MKHIRNHAPELVTSYQASSTLHRKLGNMEEHMQHCFSLLERAVGLLWSVSLSLSLPISRSLILTNRYLCRGFFTFSCLNIYISIISFDVLNNPEIQAL